MSEANLRALHGLVVAQATVLAALDARGVLPLAEARQWLAGTLDKHAEALGPVASGTLEGIIDLIDRHGGDGPGGPAAAGEPFLRMIRGGAG